MVTGGEDVRVENTGEQYSTVIPASQREHAVSIRRGTSVRWARGRINTPRARFKTRAASGKSRRRSDALERGGDGRRLQPRCPQRKKVSLVFRETSGTLEAARRPHIRQSGGVAENATRPYTYLSFGNAAVVAYRRHSDLDWTLRAVDSNQATRTWQAGRGCYALPV